MTRRAIGSCAGIALAVLLATDARGGATASRGPVAFPGAEGFGAGAKGGRGGKVLFVTNLKDYVPGKEPVVPGSLRAAVETKGPRVVVFRVSGTILLKGALRVREPYLTLAGQSAPGGGVCLRGYGTTISAEHVIVRHMRFRPGDTVGRELAKQGKSWSTDALSVSRPARDVIIDHCSTSWGSDETLSVSGEGITNVTVQWCIISESLGDSTHHKGKHGYGSLIRTNGDVTFHHNLYAFHGSRSPRPGTYPEDGSKGVILLDFRNNAIHMGGRGYTAEDPARINYVGNYVIKTTVFSATSTTEMYVEGNYLVGAGDKNDDNWRLISGSPKKRREPFPAAPVVTHAAREAYELVVESVGASLPERDAVDARVVSAVKAGKGRRIDSQSDVGGWPALEASPAPRDTDRDGMPDEWEREHGLNPRRPSDRADTDQDGYTDIEEWLNGTDPRKADR